LPWKALQHVTGEHSYGWSPSSCSCHSCTTHTKQTRPPDTMNNPACRLNLCLTCTVSATNQLCSAAGSSHIESRFSTASTNGGYRNTATGNTFLPTHGMCDAHYICRMTGAAFFNTAVSCMPHYIAHTWLAGQKTQLHVQATCLAVPPKQHCCAAESMEQVTATQFVCSAPHIKPKSHTGYSKQPGMDACLQ
jgi:hypothetical protein